MNLQDLKYLVAVEECRSFGNAARMTHVSQPTLSGQIKKLEEQLGVKIFERNNKRVLPTQVGMEIIQAARSAIKEAENIERIAQHSKNPFKTKYRIGAFPTIAQFVFPNLVDRVRKKYPDLRLILIEEKSEVLIDKLCTGEIDAAVLSLPLKNDSLREEFLFTDEFYLAVPKKHRLAKTKNMEQNLIKNFSILLLEDGHCLRDQALDVCSINSFKENSDFRASSLETLIQLVRAGNGITLIPKVAVKKSDKFIQYIPFKKPVPKRTIGLVTRKTTTQNTVFDAIKSLICPPAP